MHSEPTHADPAPRESVGQLLRMTRAQHGVDLPHVAQALRIRLSFLQAIEDGRSQDLPGPTYAVGFVRAYADYLGLDGNEMARRYKDESAIAPRRADLDFPTPVNEGGLPTGAMLLIAALLGAGIYGGWYWMSSADRTVASLIQEVPERFDALLASTISQPATPDEDPAVSPSVAGDGVGDDAGSAAPTPAPSAPEIAAADPVTTPADEPQSEAEPEVAAEAPAPEARSPVAAVEAPAPAPLPDVAEEEPAPEPSPAPEPERTPEQQVERPVEQTAARPEPAALPPPRQATSEDSAPVVEPAQAPEPAAEAEREVAAEPTPEPVTTPEDVPEPAVTASAEVEVEVAAPAPPRVPPRVPEEGQVAVAPVSEPSVPPPPPPQVEQATAVPVAPELPEPAAGFDGAVYGAPAGSTRVLLAATEDSWIQVRAGDDLVATRLLRKGERFQVPDRNGLTLMVGNAAGLQIHVDGRPLPRLGGPGEVRRGIRLEPAALLSGG